MLDPRLFQPLPPHERRRIGEEYIAFALRRDGEPDVVHRKLAKREEFFRELAARPAPKWDGEPIDPEEFAAFHEGSRPLSQARPLMAWLVRVARANEGEGWGVDYLLDRGGFDGLGKGGQGLRPRDFADLEEVYHTRILQEVVKLFGVTFELREPPAAIQTSVKLMARLPHRASYLLLLAGELMGTVAFLRMAEQGERLLEGHPEIQARVRELLDEILVDEIGHVTYLLGSMGRFELAITRRLAVLYSQAARRSYHGDDLSEARAIQDGILHYSLALFPERVLRRAFVPEPYWPAAYARPAEIAA
ncbi:MAG: hypothetical protein KatS3mg076_0940 [Candidatus Binatia bacterium]|nr:MAG: hypothetical protein KatS3mg076_0940 [Candidatus Binatia bacterium]